MSPAAARAIAGPDERVVLLDDCGRAVGSAAKDDVHGTNTPLHLALSCYVFDAADRLLVTQRAASKVTWPGVWTNTVCGHPAPGEPLADAVRRRVRQELGLSLRDLTLALPAFRYRAVADDGVVEHERCPVFHAVTDDHPDPDPAEVADTAWVGWVAFRDAVRAGRRQVSPWCAAQVAELDALGAGPSAWPAGAWEALPPAAVR